MSHRDVFQSYLDRVGQAIIEQDFETYAAHVHLPFVLVTRGGEMKVETVEELREGFDSYLDFFKQAGVRKMHRVVLNSASAGDDQISATYRTALLSGKRLYQLTLGPQILPPANTLEFRSC